MKEYRNRQKLQVSFNSPVILGFTGLCLVALLMNYITKGYSNTHFFSVYRASLLSPLTYLRLFFHVLGHAGMEHFLGNIMLILVVGPLLEEKYGSLNILFIILATALVTGMVHMIFFPRTALLGASGLAFAFIMLSSLTSIREGEIPLTFILVALLYIGGLIFEGLFERNNIANLTHILGGLVGAWLGYIMHKGKMNRY